MGIKLSISNIAWSKEYDDSMYEFINSTEYRAIEIAPTRIFDENPYSKLESAAKFADNIYNRYGLSISSIQSILYGKKENIFENEIQYNVILDYTKKAIDFAEAVGCKNVVFGCPKNRILNQKDNYSTAIKFFKEISDYAYSTVISIEPNPKIYGTNFINTTDEAFKFVRYINSDRLKVNLDIGTIIENDEYIDSIGDNIDIVNHIHISEPNLDRIQERELHKKLKSILNLNGYNRYVSIEMKNFEDLDFVKQTIYYIQKIFL